MYTVFERFCNLFHEPEPNHFIALSLEIANNSRAIDNATSPIIFAIPNPG